MKAGLSNVVGYRVLGRHGQLGVVVADDDAEGKLGTSDGETIVFRGGVSDALLFVLPRSRVRSISPSSRTLTVEVDVGDFSPRPGRDGTVELHLGR